MAGNAPTANPIVEQELVKRIKKIEGHIGKDALAIIAPVHYGLDDMVRNAVESRLSNSKGKPHDGLAVILETTGGYIEVVQRIVHTLRRHYSIVDFYIPNYAMSAGTVLAMSGDAIHMDYYSVLGPIDPQVPGPHGDAVPVPALGYLIQFERLLKKSEEAANGKGQDLTRAEVAVLLNFDQAELYGIEQARNLSVTLLKDWLVKYKFKNWGPKTQSGKTVTKQMKIDRAEQIGLMLNDTAKWHSHGRGIPMDVLTSELNIIIDDFSTDGALHDMVRSYYDLLNDYMIKVRARGAIHTPHRFVPIAFGGLDEE